MNKIILLSGGGGALLLTILQWVIVVPITILFFCITLCFVEIASVYVKVRIFFQPKLMYRYYYR